MPIKPSTYEEDKFKVSHGYKVGLKQSGMQNGFKANLGYRVNLNSPLLHIKPCLKIAKTK